MIEDLNDFIFSSDEAFFEKAISVFNFQYEYNAIYKRFVESINCKPGAINRIEQIPFLPISFFKTHQLTSTFFTPEKVFTSSGTAESGTSQHFVKKLSLYEQSFMNAFGQFYGGIENYCILGLLPSYLEREGSSLVYMVEKMMAASKHQLNGFHLYDFEVLAHKLEKLEAAKQKIAVGKTIFLSLVWTHITAILPLLLQNIQWQDEHFIFAINRYFLIYPVCILFDYRDREEDRKEGIKSMITLFPEKGINVLFYSCLSIFVITTVALYLAGMPLFYCIALFLPGLIVALVYQYSKKTTSDYYYYFFLDGLMMFSAVLLYIFSLLHLTENLA